VLNGIWSRLGIYTTPAWLTRSHGWPGGGVLKYFRLCRLREIGGETRGGTKKKRGGFCRKMGQVVKRRVLRHASCSEKPNFQERRTRTGRAGKERAESSPASFFIHQGVKDPPA